MCRTFRSQLPAFTYTGVTDSSISLCLTLYTSQQSGHKGAERQQMASVLTHFPFMQGGYLRFGEDRRKCR